MAGVSTCWRFDIFHGVRGFEPEYFRGADIRDFDGRADRRGGSKSADSRGNEERTDRCNRSHSADCDKHAIRRDRSHSVDNRRHNTNLRKSSYSAGSRSCSRSVDSRSHFRSFSRDSK